MLPSFAPVLSFFFFSFLNFISCHCLLIFTTENLLGMLETNVAQTQHRTSTVTLLKTVEPETFSSLSSQANKQKAGTADQPPAPIQR